MKGKRRIIECKIIRKRGVKIFKKYKIWKEKKEKTTSVNNIRKGKS